MNHALTVGDEGAGRLYATRNDQENRASALGKSVVSSHTVSYLAK